MASNDLIGNIKFRSSKGQRFSESQLWGLLQGLASVLSYLQQRDIYPLDLKNPLINKRVKLPPTGRSCYMQVFNGISDDYHLSPEELNCLANRSIQLNLDLEKCEVFQLGLTVVYAASLINTNTLVKDLKFNDKELGYLINGLSYSDKLKFTISQMTQMQPEMRPKFEDLLNLIQGQEIEEDLLKQIPVDQQIHSYLQSINPSAIEPIQQSHPIHIETQQLQSQSGTKQDIDGKPRIVQSYSKSRAPSISEPVQNFKQYVQEAVKASQPLDSDHPPKELRTSEYQYTPSNSKLPRIDDSRSRISSHQSNMNVNQIQSTIRPQLTNSNLSFLSNQSDLDARIANALNRSKQALHQFNQSLSPMPQVAQRNIPNRTHDDDEYLRNILAKAQIEIERAKR